MEDFYHKAKALIGHILPEDKPQELLKVQLVK